MVVMTWLQECPDRGVTTHSMVRDIVSLLLGHASCDIRHIYHEMNSIVDGISSFVTQQFDSSTSIDANIL